ncbi:ankyrin repeat protein [Apiospora hydei]|uniref:Ankyrin repeat protein n=1 Tax=Apiospora hydei TaxID=1337664 RepID=A0ABR1V7C6_9PEZI
MSLGVGDLPAVIELASEVQKNVASAPEQFEHISIELQILSEALRSIEDASLSGDEVPETHKQELSTTINDCVRLLSDIQGAVAKHSELEATSRYNGTITERAWMPSLLELQCRIKQAVTLLGFLVNGGARNGVTNPGGSLNQHEHPGILDWLTRIDYAANQSDFFGRCQAATGQWLLESTEYQQWIKTPKQSLFCPGIPGSGKTILTSIVVDDLFHRFPANGSTEICYIYCNFHRPQKLGHLLSSLLKQLSKGHTTFPQSVIDIYEQRGKGQSRPSIEDIRKTLHIVAAVYSRVFIVVDALDECQVSNGCRSRFISELLELRTQIGVNLLTTSRFVPEIAERFGDSMKKEIRATAEDIERHIEGNKIMLPSFMSTNPSLLRETKMSILKAADGMFLLARTYLNALRGKLSPKAVRIALEQIVVGSDACDFVYHGAMSRINSQVPEQRAITLQALSWITHAQRPLKAIELRHALGIELNEPGLDEDNLPSLNDVFSNSSGLVMIDENDIVRLVHHTAYEYFERTQDHYFEKAHSKITDICITYLSFDIFGQGRCDTDIEFEDRLHRYPFHDRTPLSYAAANGHSVLVQLLLEKNAMIGSKDKHGKTPVDYAPEDGGIRALLKNENMLRLLLDNNADVNSKDLDGRTPLSSAAEAGNEAAVRLFLERKAKVDSEDHKNGWTPLFGHRQRITIKSSRDSFLQKQMAIIKTNKDAQHSTMQHKMILEASVKLYWATFTLPHLVREGDQEMLEALLEMGGDINTTDGLNRTLVHLSVIHGQTKMLHMLINRNANTNRRDTANRTPLQYAVENAKAFHEKETHQTWSASHPPRASQQTSTTQQAIHDKGKDECTKPITELLLVGSEMSGISIQDWQDAFNKPSDTVFVVSEHPEQTRGHVISFQPSVNLSRWSQELPPKRCLFVATHIPDRLKPEGHDIFGISYTFLDDIHVHRLHAQIRTKSDHIKENFGDLDVVAAWTQHSTGTTVAHFTTFSCNSIPVNGIDLFGLFLRQVKEEWVTVCQRASDHLVALRRMVFDSNGNTALIDKVLCSALFLAYIRKQVNNHASSAREFSNRYCGTFPGDWVVQCEIAISEFAEGLGKELDRLDDVSQNIIQLEFNLVSINEARQSRIMSASMKRLSWITFIFLPVTFASSIFGMNIDILAENPDWRWCLLTTISLLALTFLGWIFLKVYQVETWAKSNIEEPIRHFFRWVENGFQRPRNTALTQMDAVYIHQGYWSLKHLKSDEKYRPCSYGNSRAIFMFLPLFFFTITCP